MSVEPLFETLAAYSVDPLFPWLTVFFITFVLEEGRRSLLSCSHYPTTSRYRLPPLRSTLVC